jgi:hypothetical protein
VDASGKAVLIIRKEPEPADKSSVFAGESPTSYAAFTHKVVNAAQHGVKLVLMVNDAATAKASDAVLEFRSTPGGGSVPFLMITRELGDRLLASAGQPALAELEAKIDETLKPQSRELEGVKVSAEVTISREAIAAKNVIGVIEGEGPHAEETIVIGAHYDHLGRGEVGSLAFGSRDIHNGADDNASGTATVLELARRLAARPDAPARRIVFVLFSGEERGLLGSAHYVEDPPYPIEQTVAMINLDMVGRLDEERNLVVYGTSSSETFGPMVEPLATTLGFKPKMPKAINDGSSDSDHSSFYKKDVPILFFFTGIHPDYHKPSDDSPLINYAGMAKVADLCEQVALNLASRPERPVFVKAPARPAASASAAASPGAVKGGGAYFGSRPAYGEDVEGVKLEGVTEGSPAEKAGLKGGDVIVKFGGVAVKDIESYMVAMSAKKPGDVVEVVVLRDGEEVTLKATLGARPSARPVD